MMLAKENAQTTTGLLPLQSFNEVDASIPKVEVGWPSGEEARFSHLSVSKVEGLGTRIHGISPPPLLHTKEVRTNLPWTATIPFEAQDFPCAGTQC